MIDSGKKYNKKRNNGTVSGGMIALRLILMAAVSSAAGLGAFYACRFYQESRNDGFLLGTTVQGESVYGMTPDEVAAELAHSYGSFEIILTEDGKTDLDGTLADYGYTLDEENTRDTLRNVLDTQKSDSGAVLQSILGGYQYDLTIGLDFDETVFDNKVNIGNLAVQRYPSEDAKVVYDSSAGACVIQKEVQGNEIDEDDLRNYVKSEIDEILTDVQENGFSGGDVSADSAAQAETQQAGSTETEASQAGSTGAEVLQAESTEPEASGSGTAAEAAAGSSDADDDSGEGTCRSIEFPWDLCEAPQITSDDEVLQQELTALNEYAGAQVTYDFGDDKSGDGESEDSESENGESEDSESESGREVLSFDEIAQMMDFEDGRAVLDDDKVAEYVRNLAAKYDTRYKERTFRTTLAGTITIPAGSNEYGYTIDQESEAAQLKKDIESGKAVEREPVYYTENSYGNPYYLKRNGTDDLDGTYVEVDLTAQHMWFYKDNDLIIDSDVVSGDVTKGHGTQTGVFPLAYKESPSVLTGGNGNGAYETPVQYWMPFYEGQGLHDADWRSYFGGSIYRGNGSHGCVNLPPSVAATVYNNIETGTAIVIYYE